MNAKFIVKCFISVFFLISCQTYQIAYDRFSQVLDSQYDIGVNYSRDGIFRSVISIKYDKSKNKKEYFILVKVETRNSNQIKIEKIITDTRFESKGELVLENSKRVVYYNDFYDSYFPYDSTTVITEKNIKVEIYKFIIPESEFIRFVALGNDNIAAFRIYAFRNDVIVNFNKIPFKEFLDDFNSKVKQLGGS
ncbi:MULTISPECIES: hypothetical protein [Borreliella]|uniref:Uncharacterized lipoprotein n=3 Tax=Borreliella TaxID=64895 RepID=Q0SL82_BORAP|nr:hypothetical protein [Borreliella spielmanii]ABH02396.1 hypothetical protein BAPKO_4506 [Borreliella afzelii PKo]ACJ73257.1 hypothetical protein BafACA1_D13 [Borreliella afzelii ACA-1]AJY72926.1 hypothetical protein BAFK78_D014 [Borreliella afzelii K78]APJ09325.1 hypothetical protein BLA32_05505 [Borreliella afzelii]ACN53272.1 hypothetical protein BSPA14S_D0019 [Borreliella spielmanii A14S]